MLVSFLFCQAFQLLLSWLFNQSDVSFLLRNGFSLYFMIQPARFFFYCQHIIKILFIVCCMIYKQPGFKYIISNRYIIFIHRQCEPYIVSILAISSVFIMFIFSVFFVCRIGCILYQFRDCYRSVCFRFCLSPHKRFPTLRLCKFFR